MKNWLRCRFLLCFSDFLAHPSLDGFLKTGRLWAIASNIFCILTNVLVWFDASHNSIYGCTQFNLRSPYLRTWGILVFMAHFCEYHSLCDRNVLDNLDEWNDCHAANFEEMYILSKKLFLGHPVHISIYNRNVYTL